MFRGGVARREPPEDEMRTNEPVCAERTETVEGGLNEVERLYALGVNTALAYGTRDGAASVGCRVAGAKG